MSHSCPNLVSTSFLYNPYIPFLIFRHFLFTSIISGEIQLDRSLTLTPSSKAVVSNTYCTVDHSGHLQSTDDLSQLLLFIHILISVMCSIN